VVPLVRAQSRALVTESQCVIKIRYKRFERDEPPHFDGLIDNCLLVEAKAVEKILPIHEAQLLTYMKLLDEPLGLVVDFNVTTLVDGVHRLILAGADAAD
jgi:GxxExxY protein